MVAAAVVVDEIFDSLNTRPHKHTRTPFFFFLSSFSHHYPFFLPHLHTLPAALLSHPPKDHMASGRAILGSLVATGDKLFLDELTLGGLKPWSASQFYMYSISRPEMTHFVNITEDLFQTKIKALALHKSQFENEQGLEANGRWLSEQVGVYMIFLWCFVRVCECL